MAFYPPSPSELWRYWQCFTSLSGLALEHLKKQGEKEDEKPLLQIRVGVIVRFLLASCLRAVIVPAWTRSVALCSCCQPLPRGCCPVVGNTRAELIWIIGPLIELSVIFETAFVVCCILAGISGGHGSPVLPCLICLLLVQRGLGLDCGFPQSCRDDPC